MRIGFIGLGHMGSGTARNLLRDGHEVVVFNRSREKAEVLVAGGARIADAGHEVVVFNRSREKAEVLVADGARIADTPDGVCGVSEAIMTMLADDRAFEQ